MSKFSYTRQALVGRLWFLHEQKMNEMLALASEGGAEALAALRAQRIEARRTALVPAGKGGTVAVIPVSGVISHRGGFFSMFGGCSTEELTQQLRAAVNDPTVNAVVLDVDSPGGDVDGVDELATEIYQARKQKPITAVSNCLCASAAYYLASQASELIASPSSLTGSIGVYTISEDASQYFDNLGLKVTLIKHGENKAEGNPYEPLSDAAREHLQEMVDTYGDAFEKAVARGRGVKQDDVHKKFGQGRVFDAKKAVKLGIADRVGTVNDALMKHGSSGRAVLGLRSYSAEQICHVFSISAQAFEAAMAATKKTKRVDNEDLEKSAFAYQGSDELADWKLPIRFSDEEKTKSHIRNAIARWSATEMPNAEEKKKARTRIKAAAKAHGIEIEDGSLARADVGDPDDDCDCKCQPCVKGDCSACACDACACEGCACDSATSARRKRSHAKMRRELEIAAA